MLQQQQRRIGCRKAIRWFAATAIAACLSSALQAAPFIAASWNAKHLGWADEKRDWAATAKVIRGMHFVAIQEVHNKASVARLVAELEADTGQDWSYVVSGEPVGSRRYKEFYAFVWREDVIDHEGGDVTYLDRESKFIREPFAALFRTDDHDFRFLAANIHAIYGDSVKERRAEARELDDYVRFLQTTVLEQTHVDAGRPIMLFGDFNLPPTDEAMTELDALLNPVVTKGASTLSSRNGRYANLYDQIWITATVPVTHAGIYKFPLALKVSHEYARAHISDHAPLYIRIDPKTKTVWSSR